MTIKEELLSTLTSIKIKHGPVRILDDRTDAQLRKMLAALTTAVIRILDKIEEMECDL